MTEISLIVTLNNQFNSTQLNFHFQTNSSSFAANVSTSLSENTTLTSNGSFNSPLCPMMTLKTILYCAIWPIICCCGILGNILTLIVLFRIKESSTPLQYLKSLAMADISTITIRCAYMPFVWWQLFWPDIYETWTIQSFSILWVSSAVEKISKCIIVAIVLDRVVAVILPFRYKISCTKVRISWVIVVMSIVIISTTFPSVVDTFLYMYDSKKGGNRTTEPSSQSEGKFYLLNYIHTSQVKIIHLVINRFLFDLLPILIVVSGNIIIIIGLRNSRSMKYASEDANTQRKYQERQLTKLLLFISFSFLVLCTPTDLFTFFTISNGSVNVVPHRHRCYIEEIFRTLTLVNSSINFVIYAVMNKKYREGYMSILVCCRRRMRQENSSRLKGVISTEEVKVH